MTETPLEIDVRARKSNLAFALLFLPRDRRRDALLFYDFCRTVDDLADNGQISPAERTAALARWRASLETGTGLPAALSELIRRRGLDRSLFCEIVRGMEMDLEVARYETFEELKAYCWRAACAVGLVSIRIFGCEDPGSRVFAENLGYALQLTNILRDVAEDGQRGRIYLPLEDLRRHGVSPDSLLRGAPEGDFSGLMAHEAARAREFFQRARQSLPPRDARALRCARIMAEIYQRVLALMEKDGFRVFARRYRLPLWKKMLAAAHSACAP